LPTLASKRGHQKDGTKKGGTLRTAFLNLIWLERLFAALSD
jgi:hypothetical protein